jgi:hypothetical protein
VISTVSTSNKVLVVQQKDQYKYPKKQHPRNNKQKKGYKPSQPTSTPNGNKGPKSKSKKTNKHWNLCGREGHLESKCFKKMEALESTMKKHNINLDSYSSKSSSNGHALFASSFSFNATYASSSNEWLVNYRASYHMEKDKAFFFAFNECNTQQIFVSDDRSLSVVGSGTILLDYGHVNDVLCIPSLSSNLLLVYQITHSGEGNTIKFSPHLVVIKDLEDLEHVVATRIVDDITKLYKFDNFGSSFFPSFFIVHSDVLSKLWHE